MYLLRKAFSCLLMLVLLSVLTFALFQVLPGDPVISKLGLEVQKNSEYAETLRERFFLDKNLGERYWIWLSQALKGDLGYSFHFENYTVVELMIPRIITTSVLAIMSLFFSLCLGGLWAWILHISEERRIGFLVSLFSQLGLGIPPVCLALFLLTLFGLKLGWVPLTPRINWANSIGSSLYSLWLPSLTLAIAYGVLFAKHLHTTAEQVKQKLFITLATLKGLSKMRLFFVHIFPNTLSVLLSVIALSFIDLLTGSILIENVFNIPGLGRLLVNSINENDYPLVQGIVLYYSVIVILVSFINDILLAWVDPRIRTESKRSIA